MLSIAFLLGAAFLTDTIAKYITPLYSFESTTTNDGIYKERFTNGNLRFYEEYSKGKKHGLEIEFKKNQDTLSYYHYSNGHKNGLARLFASNGKAVLEETYTNGYLTNQIILDDSLYSFDFKRLETGHEVFKSACIDCHISNKEIEEMELSKLNFEVLDSIHCSVDTIFTEELLINYMAVTSQELNVLDDYMVSLKKSKAHRFNKSIVNRNKKKRLVSK